MTGYGLPAKHLSLEFSKLGHDVAIFAFAGCNYGSVEWNGIKVFGNPVVNSHFMVQAYYEHFGADVAIQEFDIWTVKEFIPTLPNYVRIASHSPIDHFPISPWIREAYAGCDGIVPLCDFAYSQLVEAGFTPYEPIPNGVDTSIFKPLDKASCRKEFGLPEDAFIFLTVAVNKGDRKNLPQQLMSYKRFLDITKANDVIYLMHTYPHLDKLNIEGFDLPIIWEQLGGEKRYLLFTSEGDYLHGLTEEGMAHLYNCADVLMNVSKGEGLSLPIIEAMACGVPAIATDFSSMPELVDGKGWLVPVVAYDCQQLISAWFAMPSIEGTTEAMLDAYRNESKRKAFSEKCAGEGKKYDWNILAQRWIPMLEDIISKPPMERIEGIPNFEIKQPKLTKQGQHLER